MRFARIRSGLVESTEDASVIAIDASGSVLLSSGEPDTPLRDGLGKTYTWIKGQYQDRKAGKPTPAGEADDF